MSERRYTEDEVAEIFRRATETATRGRPVVADGDGMSLAQLQDIGREVGIGPDQLSRAALSLDRIPEGERRSFLGLPIGVSHTVELGRTLSDDEWERLVVDLRRTFDAKGNLTRDGSLRQWTNGNLHVYLEPGEKGHRLRMRTMNETAMVGTVFGAGFAAFFLLVSFAVYAKRGMDFGRIFFPAAVSFAGLALASASLLRIPGWARRRLVQMQGVTERLLAAGSSRADDPKADDPEP